MQNDSKYKFQLWHIALLAATAALTLIRCWLLDCWWEPNCPIILILGIVNTKIIWLEREPNENSKPPPPLFSAKSANNGHFVLRKMKLAQNGLKMDQKGLVMD